MGTNRDERSATDHETPCSTLANASLGGFQHLRDIDGARETAGVIPPETLAEAGPSPLSSDPLALHGRVRDLRDSIAADADKRQREWRADESHDSATTEPWSGMANLAAYLALRAHDVREVQVALAELGLSSLGRCGHMCCRRSTPSSPCSAVPWPSNPTAHHRRPPASQKPQPRVVHAAKEQHRHLRFPARGTTPAHHGHAPHRGRRRSRVCPGARCRRHGLWSDQLRA